MPWCNQLQLLILRLPIALSYDLLAGNYLKIHGPL